MRDFAVEGSVGFDDWTDRQVSLFVCVGFCFTRL